MRPKRILRSAVLLVVCGFASARSLESPIPIFAREQPPAPLPSTPLVLPLPAVRTLANGLEVLVVERHSLPLTTLRLVVKAGAESDSPNSPGTAQMVSALLTEGTTRRSAREIAETVDSLGATLETGADWDSSFASISLLSDHTELGLEVLSDIVLRPSFLAAEVERRRQQTLSALKVARDDPAYLADNTFRRLVFARTPYGHPEDGTAETVQNITGENLRRFHAQYYRPSNSIVSIVGDIPTQEAFALAAKCFGDWKAERASSEAPAPSGPQASGGEIVIVDKPDAVQTEIRVGSAAIRRAGPEYDALSVANQVLGGPGGNRLFQALRSQLGLTYSASSDLLCYRGGGTWVGKTFTRTAETARSLRTILDQMKHLRDRSITEQERETAEGYLIGHLALDLEASGDIAAHFPELLVEGLPLDYWNRFAHNVGAIGTDDVFEVARRFLDPKNAVIVLVGNAEAFKSDLKKLGPLRVIPVDKLDFTSESLERVVVAAGKR